MPRWTHMLHTARAAGSIQLLPVHEEAHRPHEEGRRWMEERAISRTVSEFNACQAQLSGIGLQQHASVPGHRPTTFRDHPIADISSTTSLCF